MVGRRDVDRRREENPARRLGISERLDLDELSQPGLQRLAEEAVEADAAFAFVPGDRIADPEERDSAG